MTRKSYIYRVTTTIVMKHFFLILKSLPFNCQGRVITFFSNSQSHYPLTAKDVLSRLENLTFLWTGILRWVPSSFATHAKNSENPGS